ncbi:hypothetical protein GGX14DRAFT_364546 [Mycena pura]|uniref:ML-like domain-containing protein n=1 Tax=Mycena pura TaxID=153505 RepID=A0AAD6VDE1_9AGAR|nr:hypothetical protein GGX14DRAFT_364546 [Mycena pura]
MLARLRPLFLLSLLVPLPAAADGVLFTSSVTYCEPPETLLIQQFDVKYFAQNQSIFFDISAQSVASNVSLSANILVSFYGITPVNATIDLCTILAGALCPLPQYTFNGSQSISLPDSLEVSNRIPEIAFRIPDLEAYAQLTLVEVGTGKVKACVQATLSNGWSTRQPAVEWTTAALALFTLLVALWQSTRPHTIVPYRLLDLLHFFQSIATTGLLSLNYPTLYRAFTVNFAWAMGLISSSNSKVQTSIDNMRALTGGNMANASSGATVGLVDRKLSPWDANLQLPSPSFVQPPSVGAIPFLANLSLRPVSGSSLRQFEQVQTVTDDSSNVLEAGVPIYVNSIHIATANAFMTTFLTALVVAAISIVVAALLYGALRAAKHFEWGTAETRRKLKLSYLPYIRAWVLRLSLIGLAPIMIFSFNQWTLKDSWLSILLSVLSVLAISTQIFYPAHLIFRLVRRESLDALESSDEYLASHGPLYAQYRIRRFYFFCLFLVSTLVKAIVIAAGQGSGMAQVVIFVIVELVVVIAHVLVKPYDSKGGDILSTYLALVRLVCAGLLIAFVQSIGVAAIPRVVIGAVIVVIFSIAAIVLSANLFLHSGILWLWRRKDASRGPSRQAFTEASVLEKGTPLVESKTEFASHSRSPSLHSSTADDTTARHSTSASALTVGSSRDHATHI